MDIIYLYILIFAVLFAVAVHLPMVINSYRELWLAEAKLEISKVASKMEDFLFRGEYCQGELRHDFLPKAIAYAQYKDQHIPLRFRISDDDKSNVREMDDILEEYREVEPLADKTMMDAFTFALLKAFIAKQPFVSMFYLLFVLSYYLYKSAAQAIQKSTNKSSAWVGWNMMFARAAALMMTLAFKYATTGGRV